MQKIQGESLAGVFTDLPDPRKARGIRHKLEDIVVISILAFICNADDYVDIREYGLANEDWLASFLSLEHGIPSVDTFERVFSLLEPGAWQSRFRTWTRETALGELDQSRDEILAIDGKTSRRSYDPNRGKDALHSVSVWSSYGGIVLAQEQVPDRTNDITVIPELLACVNPAGAVVTSDAMGTQKDSAWTIREYQAEYLLALKGNHPKFEDVEWLFDQADQSRWQNLDFSYTLTQESSRDRYEKRECWVLADSDFLEDSHCRDLNTIVRIRTARTHKGQSAHEHRYYLSSLAVDAERALHAARSHWGIENSLHWVLDVIFHEDHSRARTDNAQANLVTLRHIALNLLKQDSSSKLSIKSKRKRAGLG